jgi:hypothetical protein
MYSSFDKEVAGIRVSSETRDHAMIRASAHRYQELAGELSVHSALAKREMIALDAGKNELEVSRLNPIDLAHEIQSWKDKCESLLLSRTRRTEEIIAQAYKLDSDFVELVDCLDSDFGFVRTAVIKGIHDIRDSVSSEIQSIESQLLERRSEFHRLFKSRIDELLDHRKEYEENVRLDEIVKNRTEYVSSTIVLRDELSLVEQSARQRTIVQCNGLELAREQQKLGELISSANIEYEIDVIKDKGNENRSSKARTRLMQLRSRKNLLASDIRSKVSKYRSETSKLQLDIVHLRSAYETAIRKLFESDAVNRAKLQRIFKSNEREIRLLISSIHDSIKWVFSNIIGTEFDPAADECDARDGVSETGTLAASVVSVDKKSSAIISRFSGSKIRAVIDLIMGVLGGFMPISARNPIVSILSYLGVESIVELDLLVGSFTAGQEDDDDQVMVEPSEVLGLIERFVDENEERRITEAATGGKKSMNSSRDPVRLEKIKREEKKFWNRLAKSISKNTIKELCLVECKLEQELEALQRLRDAQQRNADARESLTNSKKLFRDLLADPGHARGLLCPPVVNSDVRRRLYDER